MKCKATYLPAGGIRKAEFIHPPAGILSCGGTAAPLPSLRNGPECEFIPRRRNHDGVPPACGKGDGVYDRAPGVCQQFEGLRGQSLVIQPL